MTLKIRKLYDYALIKISKKFDEQYYRQRYPDITNYSLSPLKHFCDYGWKEGKNPSKEFDTKFYLSSYPDVKEAKINPLLHYIKHGKKEGRKVNSRGLVITHYSKIEKLLYLLNDAKAKPYLISKLFVEIKNNGFKGALGKIKFFLRKNLVVSEISSSKVNDGVESSKLSIVPYYIDPVRSLDFRIDDDILLAIHIHIDCEKSFDKLILGLKPIKKFDLYLSIKDGIDISSIEKKVKNNIDGVDKIVSKVVPVEIGDIASLIIGYGNKLLEYELIGHFHTGIDKNVDLILDDSGQYSGDIITLLKGDAKVVYAQDIIDNRFKDPSGWYDNYSLSKKILEKYTDIDINNFKTIDYPKNSMFWAKSECLNEFLNLPLNYTDFYEKENRLEDILKHLVLLFSASSDGQIYCIHKEGDSLTDYCYYEEQRDYSSSIIHNDIKVLSYYLGQFHPIPENDEWHGKGFTEWTNVRSANPLFEGHYQQHIPHEDIGYYMLDTPEILKKQASMMKKSGVYGQIFYHYWFTGKLILEKPVQMLLENQDIDMPFCFCWANENWTKRWDGNDAEILLGQEYSAKDARAFIKYLIPFFQDSRYIRVDNRPVLYIYRPSSITDTKQYIDIWKQECAKVSIAAPYIVAVLTRGTVDPHDHNMDAGVERILHDWTDGGVPEMKNSLNKYREITGTILSYDSVASFYENQTEIKDFTYFRSLSPEWDNTARYKEGAYALHGSTPERFQRWFESTLQYTQNRLSEDKRFIIVNAWNEWAEGAHIEPDTYHGYSYLNSVGRALSNIVYDEILNSNVLLNNVEICISLDPVVEKDLLEDDLLRDQFIKCLSNSTIFQSNVKISSNTKFLIDEISTINSENKKSKFSIEFRKIVLFDNSFIEDMFIHLFKYPDSLVIANAYEKFTLYKPTENGSVDASLLYDASVIVSSNKSNKNVRISTKSRCFITSIKDKNINKNYEVTTIIRFHKSGSLDELKNALFCLSAMQNVDVYPLIVAQDLDNNQKIELSNLIEKIPLKNNIKIEVQYFDTPHGNGDLRSIMLNESLLKVKTRFATFLDYDDFLFSDAYSYLIDRIEETGKAISFGRVYETSYDGESLLFVKREKKYEYGYSYEEFLQHNHAPIHSFMLDIEKLDLSKIIYHEDQRYMEDYYLTLQLFREDNADWKALSDNVYIGDYIHSIDRDHTLAFSSDDERNNLLNSLEYQKDEKRISDMRKSLGI